MASKYRKKFSLPENFYPVLEDYSREVLRDQPVDIIEFSYLYFKALEEVSSALINVFRELSISSTTPRRARPSLPASTGAPKAPPPRSWLPNSSTKRSRPWKSSTARRARTMASKAREIPTRRAMRAVTIDYFKNVLSNHP